MKALLLFLAALLPILTTAQGIQRVQVRTTPTGSILYRAKTVRDTIAYPLNTSGLGSFTVNATSGGASLTLASGNIIPVGTTPPALMPQPKPDWLTGVKYSYLNGSTVKIETGGAGRIRFSHPSLPSVNPSGTTIVAGQWYDISTSGGSSGYGGVFLLNVSVDQPLSYTLEQALSTKTYAASFIVKSGATNVILAGPAPGPDCTVGPIISALTSATATGLNLTYAGSGQIEGINWVISQNGVDLRWGYSPTGPGTSIPISYASLAQGSYSIRINGESCRGVGGSGAVASFMFPDTLSSQLPSWISASALRYNYSSPTLTLQSYNNIGQMKFERLDGTSFTTVNPEGVNINSGTFYGFGGYDDNGYNRRWQVNLTSGQTYKLTAQQAGSTAAYSFSLAINGNIGATSLSGGTSPPGSTTTTDPGSVTTTTPGSSTEAVGTFAAGYGEGNLSDLMQFAPFVPSAQTDQLASWNIANVRTQYINNGTVKLGVHGIIGGAVTHLSLSGGKNWINTAGDDFNGNYTYNGQTLTGIASPGRSALSMSMYGYPRNNYSKPGHGSTTEYYDTGRNPVPGGSVYEEYSGVQAFEKRTLSNGRMAMYTKTNPFIWALHNYRSNVQAHSWFTFGDDPHVIEYFSIIENGSDTQSALEFKGAEQEAPFIFLTADLYHHYIWQGTGALTVSGLRDVTPAQPIEEANTATNSTFGGSWQGTRAFIGATDNNGNGVWLVPKYNNRFNTRRILANDGDSSSNQAAYIQSAVMMNFDTPGNHAFSGYVYVGSKQGFVDWYNAAHPTTTPFSWSFTAGKTNGWWSTDSPATFNGDNRYEWTMGNSGGGGGNFCPPYGVYNAADIPIIYLKGKFTGGITEIDIRWNRYDQDDNASNQATQVTTVSVNGNGTEQTIAIPMTGKTGWNSVISSMRFAPHLGSTVNTGMKFVPSYIGKNNPD